ncbi:MAG TPA: response regulator transcription factor [Acidimicrobiia bacterium]|nr:response regulator transcription factor [Acidimicrobiia bacterium]
MPRLLVIEDEAPVREMMRFLLEDEGFAIDEAATGEAGLEQFADGHHDLVLVDLRLPGIHGFDVCRAVRRDSDVPIIIVTAQVDSHDVVAGLEAGADDYVTKPFVAKELTARIRAALRRSTATEPGAGSPLRFGAIEIAPAEGVVRKDGVTVHLTRTEFRLLCEFAEHAGIVLSREQLLERIWGYDYLGDSRLVDAHVRRLRSKIEDDPADPVWLQTVRGLGYKIRRPDDAHDAAR